MPKEFLISDESINSYGFKVKTSGIRLDGFKTNPIGYYNHEREQGVICRWESLRRKGNKLYATPVFDLNDPFGAKIADKVDNGFIKGASVGITNATIEVVNGEHVVTSCDLTECSVCDIPSNKNALTLYANDKPITDKDKILKLCLKPNNDNMKIDLIQITSILGLKSNATTSDITEAINLLKGIDNPQSMINEALSMNLIAKYEVDELHELASANPVVFAKYLDKRKQKVLYDRQEEGLRLVNTAFHDGRLNADGAGKILDFWLNAFKNDFEGTKIALSQLPQRRSIVSAFLDKDSTDKSTWTLSDYRKKSPKELRDNPDLYKRLVEQEKSK